MTSPKTRPIAVVISDVHYSMQTLEVADKCLRQAFDTAKELNTTLIIAGDLHDTKSNIRAECMNALIETFSDYMQDVDPIVLRGNHDSTNEKSIEHSLGFLTAKSNAHIVAVPTELHIPLFTQPRGQQLVHFVPYSHDVEYLRAHLKALPDNANVIMHQGLEGALPGDYTHDKAALCKQDVARFNVISGHYHNHQVIDTGEGRTFTYVGNPYTLNFGEAKDHPKGFLVLYDDFSIQRIQTSFRRHIVFECDAAFNKIDLSAPFTADDIFLVKVRGTRHELATLTKDAVQAKLGVPDGFRLDLIPTDSEVVKTEAIQDRSATELFAAIVDKSDQLSQDDKEAVKKLWLEHSR